MSLSYEDQQLLTKTLQDLYLEGLGQHVDLPMVIICGDSDAAKHTVIEALTRICLPQEWFNHRFSMEFILSKGKSYDEVPIKISIVPASHRNKDEKAKTMTLRDDLTGTHDTWRALLEFLIGRTIVELAEFSNVTIEDVLRVQINHPNITPLILSIIPKWPPHADDFNLNKHWLLKRIQSSRSITLIAHDNLPLLKKSKINRFLHSNLDGGGDRTRAIFVVRYSLTAEEAPQLKAVTSNACRGYSFKLGWEFLKENSNNAKYCISLDSNGRAISILGAMSRIDPYSGPICDGIVSQSEQAAILDVAGILKDIDAALLHCRFARRAADGSPGTVGEARDYAALEEKCALLEKALRALQRFDPFFSSTASSTVDPIHTPTESEMHGSTAF